MRIMVRPTVLIALSSISIAFGPAFVNAEPRPDAVKQSKQTAKKRTVLSLAEFISKVMAEGEDDKIGSNSVRHLGIDPNNETKNLEKLTDECVDNRDRSVDVVVEKVPKSDQLKPVSVLLLAKRTRPGAVEHDWFKLKPDGTIEKAFRSSGKLSADGHGIPGSAVDVDFDPDEAKALLKRELDFWLKGIGLKKKPAAETAKQDAANSKAGASSKPGTPAKTEAPAKFEPK